MPFYPDINNLYHFYFLFIIHLYEILKNMIFVNKY